MPRRAKVLVAAVRTVAGGESLLSPSITRRLIEDFCKRPPRSATLPEITQELTSRELDVLRLLARGLSNAEIAQELYLEATTIKSHVTRLFQKLGLRDRAQAIVFAYESGIVRPGEIS